MSLLCASGLVLFVHPTKFILFSFISSLMMYPIACGLLRVALDWFIALCRSSVFACPLCSMTAIIRAFIVFRSVVVIVRAVFSSAMSLLSAEIVSCCASFASCIWLRFLSSFIIMLLCSSSSTIYITIIYILFVKS